MFAFVQPLTVDTNFLSHVLDKFAKPGSNVIPLKQLETNPVQYKKGTAQRALKSSAKSRLYKLWIYTKPNVIQSVFWSTPNAKDNLIVILKIIIKKSGLFVAKKTNIQLSIPQCVTMHGHFKGDTNSLYRHYLVDKSTSVHVRSLFLCPYLSCAQFVQSKSI